ncbi:N-acetylglucosaminyl deacetylase, LmbE family [Micromonospora sediminicola]|uniref:N-acetylglucosaminyl deacetylase, LmbE family n=1 Tax=Micromonospora sediminicola TaxID=946078 RepID=A0A1A9B9S3_9ACTN|nr:PIG-L family deacetylase [Micromonospora sediminicola]SBT65821.1 N-acetylglucosaminyl deacetylase, LmbE family [Micromonospora sediminicola]
MTGRDGRAAATTAGDRHRIAGRAVAVSPHLDDAVFSAGGTLAALVAAGWTVRVVTCFTATVPDPPAFALACQLDKGLPADVDYMALRRAEDRTACAVLGVRPVHLPLAEAPHRGYADADALFAGVRRGDPAVEMLAPALRAYLADADLVLAPQALGDHVDHQIVAETVAGIAADAFWWRDVPYVARRPAATPWRCVPAGVEVAVDIADHLVTKVDAAGRYRSQLAYQFGDAGAAVSLRDLAVAEATRLDVAGAVEALRGPTTDRLPLGGRSVPGAAVGPP